MNIANIYMKLKDFQNALDCFNNAGELVNNLLISKGTCHENLNQIDEAIRCYDEAIIRNVEKESAYFLKSNCLYEKKEFELALDALKKASDIDPAYLPYEDLKNKILRDQINYYIINNGLKT